MIVGPPSTPAIRTLLRARTFTPSYCHPTASYRLRVRWTVGACGNALRPANFRPRGAGVPNDPGLLQVEPVVVHHFDPRGDEVLDELPLRVVLCIDLGQRTQHRVRPEHEVIRGRGPFQRTRGPVVARVDVLGG